MLCKFLLHSSVFMENAQFCSVVLCYFTFFPNSISNDAAPPVDDMNIVVKPAFLRTVKPSVI